MSFNGHGIICILTLVQLLLLSGVLLSRREGGAARNALLAVLLFAMAMCTFNNLMYTMWAVVFASCPHLLHVFGSGPYLQGPALYLYTRSLLEPDFRLRPRHALHALPFVAHVVLLMGTYTLNDAESKRMLITRGLFDHPVFQVFFWSLYAMSFTYVTLAYRVFRRYQARVKEVYSSTARLNLNWLRFVLGCFAGIWVLSLASSLVDNLFDVQFAGFDIMGRILMFSTAYVMVFLGLRYPDLFGGMVKARYGQSALSEADKRVHLDKLLAHMDREKPYLEPSLTLSDLSLALDMPVRTLSQVINESLGRNFFDFINGYRIEEAKKHLVRPASEKRTVLEILYDTGFNSKSAFNRAFKEHTGMSPTQFRKLSRA